MIKAIVLDCFGVLYVPKNEYIYQSLLVNPTVHHDEIRDLVHQVDYGLIDTETLFEAIARFTGKELSEVRRHLTGDFVRNQELLQYAQTQRKRGTKVGLLSNLGLDSMRRYFSTAEQKELFDAVVVSSNVGMVKPNPEIFEFTCRQLSVDVSEAVMVDDVEENCAGARSAGLQAILYESLAQTQAALQRSLSE